MNVTLSLTDSATPALARKLAAVQPARIARIAGPAMRECWRNALAALPSNRRGWPSTGFWEAASRSIRQPEYSGDTVTLTANKQGLRQRWLGGRITARDKALTIPISPESYGKTASQVPGLFLLVTKKGAYLVRNTMTISASGGEKFAHAARKGVVRQRASLSFLFKLIARGGSVTQRGNPAVVPQEQVLAAGMARLEGVLK